jgi:hypothetical protein
MGDNLAMQVRYELGSKNHYPPNGGNNKAYKVRTSLHNKAKVRTYTNRSNGWSREEPISLRFAINEKKVISCHKVKTKNDEQALSDEIYAAFQR